MKFLSFARLLTNSEPRLAFRMPTVSVDMSDEPWNWRLAVGSDHVPHVRPAP